MTSPASTVVPALIDLPSQQDLRAWCVIAADQYSSSPQYWEQVAHEVGDAPSTLHLIVPEVYLPQGDAAVQARVRDVHSTMVHYLQNVLTSFGPAAVYVERQTPFTEKRRSLIAALDLEAYSFTGEQADVRASEATVLERLPTREAIRAGAALELPHVQVLFDDPQDVVFSILDRALPKLPPLYDTDLILGGGNVKGWRVAGDSEVWHQVQAALEALPRQPRGFGYIVGDGNHSLAAARSHWLRLKEAGADGNHPARWALVELLNIHEPGLRVEPIHRWVGGVSADEFAAAASAHRQNHACCAATAVEIMSVPVGNQAASPGASGGDLSRWQASIAHAHPLLVESVDEIIGGLVATHSLDPSKQVEYVHGVEDLAELISRRGGVGVVLPTLSRSTLFDYVAQHGVMPKKSFSLGEAVEKRYYCECRRLLP